MRRFLSLIIFLNNVIYVSAINKGFIENKGQIINQNNIKNKEALFILNLEEMNVILKKGSFSYDLFKESDKKIDFHRIDIELINANEEAIILKEGETLDYEIKLNNNSGNYEKHNIFTKITYLNIYNNIDIEFVFNEFQKKFEYNFIIHPNGKISDIKLKYNGGIIKTNIKQEIEIETRFGILTECIPESWYVINNKKEKININYTINEKNIVSFKSKLSQRKKYKLIIDPTPIRNWGTYYGGSGLENILYSQTDSNGNVYITGEVSSTNNIATSGAHQSSYGGGTNDAFIAKLNSSGIRMWATYIGGSGLDIGHSISVNSNNELFLVGRTTSLNNIATSGSFSPTHQGGTWDAFIIKLNSNGAVIWGSYLGGTGDDRAFASTLDNNGDLYVVGQTTSTSQISTIGTYQTSHNGGTWDGFIVKFNNNGNRIWGTYIGGNSSDYLRTCSTDNLNNLIVAGWTSSTTNIASTQAHQTIYGGGVHDGLVAKLNPNGGLLWSSYYGGSNDDWIIGCNVDLNNNIFITGQTESSNNIATPNSYQSSFGGPAWDGFLVKLNENGSRIWGTYYGGTDNDDHSHSCIVDNGGNIIIVGYTSSTTGIATNNTYQTNYAGNGDAFIAKFNNNGNILWGTYYGGSNFDVGRHCCFGPAGELYVVGETMSNNSIATSGSHDATYNGGWDGFLVKFDPGCIEVPNTPNDILGELEVCAGTTNIYSTNIDNNTTNYIWTMPSDWTGSSNSNTISTNIGSTSGTLTVYAQNNCGISNAQSIFVNVLHPPDSPNFIYGDSIICFNDTILTFYVNPVTNATGYQWNLPSNWNGSSNNETININTNNNSGIISVSSFNNCGASPAISKQININNLPVVNLDLTIDSTCSNIEFIELNGGFPLGGIYSSNYVTNNYFYPFLAGSGIHIINYTFIDTNGCENYSTDSIVVLDCTNIIEHNMLNNFDVFPNPFNDYIFVSINFEVNNYTIKIYDFAGKLVLNKKITDSNSKYIDTSFLENGTYMIVIENESENLVKKLNKL